MMRCRGHPVDIGWSPVDGFGEEFAAGGVGRRSERRDFGLAGAFWSKLVEEVAETIDMVTVSLFQFIRRLGFE